MTLRSRGAAPANPVREKPNLERHLLVLQTVIVGLFLCGAFLGWFGKPTLSGQVCAAWIGVYHAVQTFYILRYRIPGRPISWVESLTPVLNVSCVTTVWVVLGQAESPFWAVYLYALVGYGRRFHGRKYFTLASFILVNLVAGHSVIALREGSAILDGNLVTMVVLAAAMGSLSHAIGSAWRQAERQARILAETDPLTGIANRRVFLERLESLTQDPDERVALLMLDLDDFKRLNDEHGHLYGDDVLAKVAAVLSENIREGDQVARYGGEEFVVAMPATGLGEATVIAERLRTAVAESTPTTVSVGCSVRNAGESAHSTLKRADDFLLLAKRTGKNAVRSSDLRLTA